MSQKIGSLAEQQARSYLTTQGLHWIESNYRCRMGEIDLIMRDREHLVFVEVRVRSSDVYGGAIASVTFSKKQKLIKTALLYVLVRQLQDKQPIRFDVLSIDGVPPMMTWVKDAFGADY